MTKLITGMIASFIIGCLVALPFTSASNAADVQTSSSDTSDDDMVCCDETIQYGGIEFKTRKACRNSTGVVVADNKCVPNDDGAVAERSDAAGFDGARDIGDVPSLSADSPTQSYICNDIECTCDKSAPSSDEDFTCIGMDKACLDKGWTKQTCTRDLLTGTESCSCSVW